MRSYGTLRYMTGPAGRGVWVIDAEPHIVMRLKRVFARINPARSGELRISDTPETAADLEWVMTRWPLELDQTSRARLQAGTHAYREAQEAVDLILAGSHRLPFALTPAREPYDYQLQAADLALTTGRLLLGDDLGLGKSFAALLLLRHPDALPALVVCPVHLQRQWLAELHASFTTLHGHIIRATKVYDPSKTRAMHGHQPDVLIISYAKLAAWSQHLAGVMRTVIFDETQELRRSGSSKYHAAGQIADAARFCIGTTATPVYNYGGEIHTVMQVIARDALGTREEFVREWGRSLSNGRVAVNDPRALGAHMREENLFLRRTRAEVGKELGDLIRVPHMVDADPEVIEHETRDAVGLAELIVTGGGSRTQRFQAAGDLDWQMRRATGLAKAPYVAAFIRLLLESEPKLLLFGWHRDVYEHWQATFEKHRIGYELYTGSESPAAKQRSRDRFLEDEQCRVLVMSLRSGAGLDGLQSVCRVAVFGELDWSPEMHEQCLGRLHRDGQEDPVVGYFLTCDYGSDPTVMEVLGFKRGQAEPLRDPNRPLFEQMEAHGDRVCQLAQAVLAKQRPTERAA